jgi:hypothetical protein
LFSHLTIYGHFLVLIALAQDATLPLFDLGRFPRGIEVMQRYQPFLNVGADAHLLRAADETPLMLMFCGCFLVIFVLKVKVIVAMV